jgi:hypothetical protein
MSKRILTTTQSRDPGSEGGAGYAYQWHVASRLAIQMLLDKRTEYIVCEFHEDAVEIRRDMGLKLVQIKKRDTGHWTLQELIKPRRGQKQGILGKLLAWVEYGKDVHSLHLYGCGRIGSERDISCSLTDLIHLLAQPYEHRDDDWYKEYAQYVDYLSSHLEKQGISRPALDSGLRRLEIDLGLPVLDAIQDNNCRCLDKCVRQVWNVELSRDEIDSLYQDVYQRIREASVRPGRPWTDKSVSRTELLDWISSRLRGVDVPSENRRAIKTTQDKLTSVRMGDKVNYAFERRLDAMYLKFELDISSLQWEDFKTQIDVEWRHYRSTHEEVQGPLLWQALREMLARLAEGWNQYDKRMDATFAEGVFFDMTGSCEAEWRS